MQHALIVVGAKNRNRKKKKPNANPNTIRHLRCQSRHGQWGSEPRHLAWWIFPAGHYGRVISHKFQLLCLFRTEPHAKSYRKIETQLEPDVETQKTLGLAQDH